MPGGDGAEQGQSRVDRVQVAEERGEQQRAGRLEIGRRRIGCQGTQLFLLDLGVGLQERGTRSIAERVGVGSAGDLERAVPSRLPAAWPLVARVPNRREPRPRRRPRRAWPSIARRLPRASSPSISRPASRNARVYSASAPEWRRSCLLLRTLATALRAESGHGERPRAAYGPHLEARQGALRIPVRRPRRTARAASLTLFAAASHTRGVFGRFLGLVVAMESPLSRPARRCAIRASPLLGPERKRQAAQQLKMTIDAARPS